MKICSYSFLLPQLPQPRMWRGYSILLLSCLFLATPWLTTTSWAAEDLNWSSGLYRAEPGHNPFGSPLSSGGNRNPTPKNQWWDEERLPRSPQDPYTPRLWEEEKSQRPMTKKNRPWGEIPPYLDEYDANRLERSPRNGNRSTFEDTPPRYRDEQRPQRPPRDYYLDQEGLSSRNPSSYWDGPYQREETRRRYDRYDRSYEDSDPTYWDRYPSNDADSWWRGRRNRQKDWDPWDRNRLPPDWER